MDTTSKKKLLDSPALTIASKIAGYASLIVIVLVPILFYADRMSLYRTKDWMLVATIVWFIAAGHWMSRK